MLPKYNQEVSDNKVMTSARLTWGKTTCRPENHITLKTKVIKSFENLFDNDRYESRMYEGQCDEYSCPRDQDTNEFSSSKLSPLKYHVDINYNNVPFFIQNYTNKVFNLLKHHFYEQSDVSQIMIRNPEKKIRAIVTIDPIHKQYINITIRTPKENTLIHDIPTPFLALLKSRRSHIKNVWEQDSEQMLNFDESESEYKQYNRETEFDTEYTTPYNKYNTESDEYESEYTSFESKYNAWEQPEWTGEQSDEYEIKFDGEHIVLKHKLVDLEDKICVSLQRIPQCVETSRPIDKIQKRFAFHCVHRNNPRVSQFEDRVLSGERIPEIERSTPSMTRTVVVPIKCTKSIY